MRIRTLKYLFVLTSVLVFAPAAEGAGYSSVEHAAANVVYAAGLRAEVEFFCDTLCDGRSCGSVGSVLASRRAAALLRKWKLKPLDGSYYLFCPDTTKHQLLHSVAACLEPNASLNNGQYIIVCAHLDGIGKLGNRFYPGADSNASGAVAVLNLAHLFSSMKMLGRGASTSLIFVLTDGKEAGSAGAKDLVRRIRQDSLRNPSDGRPIREKDIRMLVNIDQLGSTLSPVHAQRPDYLMMLGNERLKNGLSELAHTVNRECGSALDLCFDYYGSKTFSDIFYRLADREAYAECAFPLIFFTSGITMNNNKPSDTPSTLDYEVLRRRILMIFHWLCRIV